MSKGGGEGRRLTIAQQRLVESPQHLRIVRSKVRAFRRLHTSLDADELHSCAMEALVLAALRFDPQHGSGSCFMTYAARWVDGAMLRYANRERRHRYPALALLAASGFTDDGTSNGASPPEEQAALRQAVINYALDLLLRETHGTEPASPEEATLRKRQLDALQAARRALPVDYADLLLQHYNHGQSLNQLARARRLSRGAIQAHHGRALALLRNVLARGGGGTPDATRRPRPTPNHFMRLPTK